MYLLISGGLARPLVAETVYLYVPALAEVERRQGLAIWLHTHSGQDGEPFPSNHDFKVDHEIAELFRIRTNSDYYGTLIVSPRADDIVFTGTVRVACPVFFTTEIISVARLNLSNLCQ